MKNGEKVIEMQKVAMSCDWKGCYVMWPLDSDIAAMSVLHLELAMMYRVDRALSEEMSTFYLVITSCDDYIIGYWMLPTIKCPRHLSI